MIGHLILNDPAQKIYVSKPISLSLVYDFLMTFLSLFLINKNIKRQLHLLLIVSYNVNYKKISSSGQ